MNFAATDPLAAADQGLVDDILAMETGTLAPAAPGSIEEIRRPPEWWLWTSRKGLYRKVVLPTGPISDSLDSPLRDPGATRNFLLLRNVDTPTF